MDHVVFDAEPLIAYYWDEPGSDDVEAIIDCVEDGELKGTVNTVTCTEVRYVCGRDDPQTAKAYVARIRDWCDVVTAEEVWESAADYKRDYNVALGDAYTLATAVAKEATAYTGADDDFDDVDVTVKRFREEGV
ncbi:PIN domain-containing protein [Halorubrum sp. GN11_10-6_MGM]|uniref:type II toxin-antitoxin system VapC family toxin n=1 Tax=Halorubrum sp. GN11_10-6_MGM TaxID=2518112 RepID=UPI0010F8193F|nr:PIN domain-containing protein [Halorubrum sp. GN11_10-6_MGM]TKX72755.1 PIN domain-containing protein [Halorubrum sp. GN11_10-6_MGM]